MALGSLAEVEFGEEGPDLLAALPHVSIMLLLLLFIHLLVEGFRSASLGLILLHYNRMSLLFLVAAEIIGLRKQLIFTSKAHNKTLTKINAIPSPLK